MLNGLNSAFGQKLSKEALSQVIRDCGLPADIRGERLTLQDFAHLSHTLLAQKG